MFPKEAPFVQKSPHDDDSPSNATAKKLFFVLIAKKVLGLKRPFAIKISPFLGKR